MENENVIDQDFSAEELVLTEEAKGYLRESAKWAKFLAILGFIFIGLFALGGLIIAANLGALGDELPFPSFSFLLLTKSI